MVRYLKLRLKIGILSQLVILVILHLILKMGYAKKLMYQKKYSI
jgi:hypothetical protein